MPNIITATSRRAFPLHTGDQLAGQTITDLTWSSDTVTAVLADGTTGRYRLDLLPGGAGRWILER